MGGRGGRRVSARSPLGGATLWVARGKGARSRRSRGSGAAPALAQRQPSPLGGTGVTVWGSADAEHFSFSRFYPRAAAATRALARGYPSGTPLTRLWALRAGWASREARCCAQGHRGASSRGRMHRGASLHSGYEVVRVGCRGGAQGDQSGMVRLKKSISGSTCSRLMMALSSSTLAGYSAARSWSSWMSVARL